MARQLTHKPDAIAFTIISKTGSPIYVLIALRLRRGRAYHMYAFKRFYDTPSAKAFVQSHGDIPDTRIYYTADELPFPRVRKGQRYDDHK